MLTRRALVLLIAALAGAGIAVRLGLWQLDRAAQKNAIEAAMDTRRAMQPLLAAYLAQTEAAAREQHYRATVVSGRWLSARTVYLDNRPMNGHAGFIVVTPLLLADGSSVIVQRGWLPRDQADRTHVTPPHDPADAVQVAGRIAPPPSRMVELGADVPGPIRQNLDLTAFAHETGLRLRPLSIVQEDGPLTAPDGLLRQWPRPAADVAKHYGYAFQWLAIATLIIGLYAWFQLIRPRSARR
jgi:surfeit locus 1 family protein